MHSFPWVTSPVDVLIAAQLLDPVPYGRRALVCLIFRCRYANLMSETRIRNQHVVKHIRAVS